MRPISFEDDLSRLIDQAQPSLLFEGSTPVGDEELPLRLGEICRILSVRMNCKIG